MDDDDDAVGKSEPLPVGKGGLPVSAAQAKKQEKKKDNEAEMRKQMIAAAVADLVRTGYFGDHDVAEDGLPITFQLHLICLFIPDSPSKKYWDLFIVLLVLWNCGMVPMELAFEDYIPPAFDPINSVIDVFFFFDICANFRTAIVNDKEELIFSQRAIASKYVSGKWFYIDLVSTIPWELMFVSLNTESTRTVFKLLSCVKMVRLLRLSKFFRWLNKVLGKYANAVRVFQLFFVFVLSGHWVGCVTYLIEIVIMKAEVSSFNSEESFMGRYALALTIGIGSLMGNTGYSTNEATELFLILAICAGTGLGAVIFGNMANIISNAESVAGKQRIKADYLDEASHALQLPKDLTMRISEFHEYMWGRSADYIEALDLPSLSTTLRDSVVQFLYEEMMKTSKFFSNMSPALAFEVIQELQQVFFAPADIVCNEGAVGDRMFFLTHGQLELSSMTLGKKKKEVVKNNYIWGAECLGDIIRQDQSEPAGPWEGRYYSTGLCHSYCEMYVLMKEKVKRLLEETNRPRYLKKMLHKAFVQQKIAKQMGGDYRSGNFFLRPIFDAWMNFALVGTVGGNSTPREGKFKSITLAPKEQILATAGVIAADPRTEEELSVEIEALKHQKSRAVHAEDFHKATQLKSDLAKMEKLLGQAQERSRKTPTKTTDVYVADSIEPLDIAIDTTDGGGMQLQKLEQKVDRIHQRMEAFMHEHSQKLDQILDLLENRANVPPVKLSQQLASSAPLHAPVALEARSPMHKSPIKASAPTPAKQSTPSLWGADRSAGPMSNHVTSMRKSPEVKSPTSRSALELAAICDSISDIPPSVPNGK
jgi:hypothetical protein